MNLDSQPFKWFYLFAHTLAVISIIGTFVYGIRQRKKSLLGFQLSTVLDYSFRIFLISAAILLLYKGWDFVFFGIWDPNVYWDNRQSVGYLITYCLSFAFAIFSITIIIKYIWKLSLTGLINGLQTLAYELPFTRKRVETNSLIIDKAIYGTRNSEIDVTAILNSMIVDNSLTVVASNSLAGDPEPGIVKSLTITYRYNGVPETRAFPEGGEVKLPKRNQTP